MAPNSLFIALFIIGSFCFSDVSAIVWTSQNTPTTAYHTSVAYGLNRWVVAGKYPYSRLQFITKGGSTFDSSHQSWASAVLPSSVESMVYNVSYHVEFGDKFVAIPSTPEAPVLVSVDGITFDIVVTTERVCGHSILFRHGMYVAAGCSSTLFTSQDGLSWRSQTLSVHASALDFVNDSFVVFGTDISGHVRSQTSRDGELWAPSGPYSQLLASKAFGKLLTILHAKSQASGAMVAIETDRGVYIATTKDFAFWKPVLSLPSAVSAHVAQMGSVWFVSAFSKHGRWSILRSRTSGADWEDVTSSLGSGRGYVTASSDSLFVIGARGLLITSRDGLNWWHINEGISCQITGLFYCENLEKYVLSTTEGIFLSSSGSRHSWMKTSSFSRALTYAQHSNEQEVFAALDDSMQVVTSNNLRDWKRGSSPLPAAVDATLPPSTVDLNSPSVYQLLIGPRGKILSVISYPDVAGTKSEIMYTDELHPSAPWKSALTASDGFRINAVAYGNGIYVALRSSNTLVEVVSSISGNDISFSFAGWRVPTAAAHAQINLGFFGHGHAAGFFAVSLIHESKTFISRDGVNWTELPVRASSIGFFRYSQSWIATSIGQSFVSYDGYSWLPDVPINVNGVFSAYQQSRQLLNAVAVSSLDNSIMTGHL